MRFPCDLHANGTGRCPQKAAGQAILLGPSKRDISWWIECSEHARVGDVAQTFKGYFELFSARGGQPRFQLDNSGGISHHRSWPARGRPPADLQEIRPRGSSGKIPMRPTLLMLAILLGPVLVTLGPEPATVAQSS